MSMKFVLKYSGNKKFLSYEDILNEEILSLKRENLFSL